MAIILNVYDKLIHGVSAFAKDKKRYGTLLLQFCLGGIIGMVTLSGILLDLVMAQETIMMYLFCGAIAGSIFPLYRKASLTKIKPSNFAAAAVGFFICVVITWLPKDLFAFSGDTILLHILLLLAAGLIVAVALVLPGISASYVLLMLGMYDLTLQAIRYLRWEYLLPLGIGALGGIFLTAGILEREMKKHPQFTYMLIIGFVFGSLLDVFPGLPKAGEWIWCVAACASGFVAVYSLGLRAE